ncbi:MAG: ABC transporter permease [Bdellovibrionales bacterium]|nr:ABC transporter permease [Bdellovibrionales bacterium]
MITKNFLLISNRNYSAFKKSLGVSLIWIYSEPLIMFLVLGYGIGALIDRIEGGSYLKFITPGFILATLLQVTFYESGLGLYSKLKDGRFFRSLSITPITKKDIILGEIFWGALKGLFSLLILFLIGLMSGIISVEKIIYLFPFLLFVSIIFSSMGTMICSFSTSQNTFLFIQALVVFPMYFLSGVFFPLDLLPTPLFILSLVFPLTHAVMIFKAILSSQIESTFFINFAVLFVYGFVFLNLSLNKLAKKLQEVFGR